LVVLPPKQETGHNYQNTEMVLQLKERYINQNTSLFNQWFVIVMPWLV